jgi:hypothetical protein
MDEKENVEELKRKAIAEMENAENWKRKALEEHKKNVEFLKNKIPELKAMVSISTRTYRIYLNRWLKLLAIFWLGFGGSFLLYYFLPLPSSNFSSLQIVNIANSIFDPSVTIAGIVTGFFPVIGFFYLTEIKESQTRQEQEIGKQINDCLNPKDFGETENSEIDEKQLEYLNEWYSSVHNFGKNLRDGLLQYMAIYLVVAILVLFFLLILYIPLSILNPIFFIALDMLLLGTTLSGIFPVIQVALMKIPS